MKKVFERTTWEQHKVYGEWADAIPYMQFPAEWKIKIVPPFAGAAIRFYVEKPNGNISVYLDMEDNLGSVGEPYWELYPNADGECSRYLLNEHDQLLAEIKTLL